MFWVPEKDVPLHLFHQEPSICACKSCCDLISPLVGPDNFTFWPSALQMKNDLQLSALSSAGDGPLPRWKRVGHQASLSPEGALRALMSGYLLSGAVCPKIPSGRRRKENRPPGLKSLFDISQRGFYRSRTMKRDNWSRLWWKQVVSKWKRQRFWCKAVIIWPQSKGNSSTWLSWRI